MVNLLISNWHRTGYGVKWLFEKHQLGRMGSFLRYSNIHITSHHLVKQGNSHDQIIHQKLILYHIELIPNVYQKITSTAVKRTHHWSNTHIHLINELRNQFCSGIQYCEMDPGPISEPSGITEFLQNHPTWDKLANEIKYATMLFLSKPIFAFTSTGTNNERRMFELQTRPILTWTMSSSVVSWLSAGTLQGWQIENFPRNDCCALPSIC